ncbi:MAG: hypothetical protein HN411_00685 [Waddliaceae bacterium]|jgi:hypothetical protein|nr:hypothetical protein [Waddliaceae bacterium]MBT3579500.1 hypothetical protein [Waddliaceae bacterium]MBT4444643.1 hypothetical protein [Waddliaceae bacterium]MBT6929208.1 hypothetical protein [Waddliaceae bacterium]MBT7264777.1 hypothetical protein [Waddliaceae bacterium]
MDISSTAREPSQTQPELPETVFVDPGGDLGASASTATINARVAASSDALDASVDALVASTAAFKVSLVSLDAFGDPCGDLGARTAAVNARITASADALDANVDAVAACFYALDKAGCDLSASITTFKSNFRDFKDSIADFNTACVGVRSGLRQ